MAAQPDNIERRLAQLTNEPISGLTVGELEAMIVTIVRKTIAEEKSNLERQNVQAEIAKTNVPPPPAFLETFGSWEDERSPEEIVENIYASRTIAD